MTNKIILRKVHKNNKYSLVVTVASDIAKALSLKSGDFVVLKLSRNKKSFSVEKVESEE